MICIILKTLNLTLNSTLTLRDCESYNKVNCWNLSSKEKFFFVSIIQSNHQTITTTNNQEFFQLWEATHWIQSYPNLQRFSTIINWTLTKFHITQLNQIKSNQITSNQTIKSNYRFVATKNQTYNMSQAEQQPNQNSSQSSSVSVSKNLFIFV